ncbi:MAG: SurA N-terminal domain-containing protein [Desulfobulbales bacterium]
MQGRLHIIFLSSLLFFLMVSHSYGEHLIDRVVAVVNDDVITLSELNKTGKEFFARVKEKAPEAEMDKAMAKARDDVLSSMIDKTIVRQQAEKLSITVAEEEVDAAIDQILARNNATIEDFRRELAAMNLQEQEYRDNIRDQILQSKLINYEVRSRIVVIEDEIKEYYQKEYTQEKGESGYHILQIGFTWRNSVSLEKAGFDTKEEAREKAEEVRTRVLDGESFKGLAQSYSNLPSAADGGDIGIFKKDELADYMKDVILAMKPGDISPIVETGNTFQFFKLLSVREGDIVVKAPYESVREEIRDILYRAKMEDQYKKWVKSLRDEAYVKILL